MAADQRKKRLNPSSVVCHTSREQYKAKKKKLKLPRYDIKTRSNISLEWDDKKKSVVAKREQISIARRDSIQYIDAFPHCHNILTDVFTVPQEIFELKNLTEVLSYEVWQTHLSEKERKLLMQFLPKGANADEIVQELLSGDNFRFGNPFLKWGSSLCSGNFHPDAVLHQEPCFKANKNAYYSELQKYHTDMIKNLQMWKERWASCKDPEKEIVEKIWRSRKHAEKSMLTPAIDYRLRDPDENLVATSESCSWAADEKACSSDNLNLMMMQGESQSRICRKDFTEGKYDNSSDGLKVVAGLRKGEKLLKRNIHSGDGAQYMSYIKVSKEQHQRVKSSMKQSSNSIQPRSLNHVLGNLDTFNVQPYEVFEEEERQKLHVHWLQLANRDLPSGFANLKRRQAQKRQLMKSLVQEMQGKLKYLNEDEEGNPQNMLPEQTNNGASDLESTSTMEGEDKEKSDSMLQEEQIDNGATSNDPSITLENVEKKSPDCIYQQDQMDHVAAVNYEFTIKDENESVPASPQKITLCSASHEFRPMELDSKIDYFPPNVSSEYPATLSSEYPENLNHVASAYYHSTCLSHEYASVGELSLAHAQVMEEQPARLIDLESDNARKNMLHRQSENEESFFSPYLNPNQDHRHELLQSFFKGQEGILPFHHEQKQTSLNFQPPANQVMMETGGQLPAHFHPSMPLELRHKRLNDLYIHQNIQLQENMYSDVGRYSITRQEHLTSLNIQDWAPQSHLNGGGTLSSQNWFSGEHQGGRGVWSGSEGDIVPNQSIGNVSNAADQNLFSVLSQCNELRSCGPYDSMGSTERFIQPGSHGGIDGGVSTTNNPLNYLSGHEASAGLKANNLGWASLPHQNTALQESMGKPFLRSWNR